MGTENYYQNINFSYFFQYHRRNNEPNPQLKLYLKYSCKIKKITLVAMVTKLKIRKNEKKKLSESGK